MPECSPDRMEAVLARCQSANEAIGSAFSTAFGGDYQVKALEATQINLDDLPASFAGAGLVFGITIDETRCLAVLAKVDTLLPDWCAEPGDESAQKLNQLVTIFQCLRKMLFRIEDKDRCRPIHA